jgi:hypothetical protein
VNRRRALRLPILVCAASMYFLLAADAPVPRAEPPTPQMPQAAQVAKTVNPWPPPMLVYWAVVAAVGLGPALLSPRRRPGASPSTQLCARSLGSVPAPHRRENESVGELL